jgi:hypothetical protein
MYKYSNSSNNNEYSQAKRFKLWNQQRLIVNRTSKPWVRLWKCLIVDWSLIWLHSQWNSWENFLETQITRWVNTIRKSQLAV